MSNKFYMMDSRGYVGNCVLWWRVGGHGYTTDLSEAGVYSAEEATAMHESRPTDKPVETLLARAVSRPTVDMQKLNEALDISKIAPTHQHDAG